MISARLRLCITFAVRQGGASASSTPQNGDPALACTALVRPGSQHAGLFFSTATSKEPASTSSDGKRRPSQVNQ